MQCSFDNTSHNNTTTCMNQCICMALKQDYLWFLCCSCHELQIKRVNNTNITGKPRLGSKYKRAAANWCSDTLVYTVYIFIPFVLLILPGKNQKKSERPFLTSLNTIIRNFYWYTVSKRFSYYPHSTLLLLKDFSKIDFCVEFVIRCWRYQFWTLFKKFLLLCWELIEFEGKLDVWKWCRSSQYLALLFAVMVIGDCCFKSKLRNDGIQIEWSPLWIEDLTLLELPCKSLHSEVLSEKDNCRSLAARHVAIPYQQERHPNAQEKLIN